MINKRIDKQMIHSKEDYPGGISMPNILKMLQLKPQSNVLILICHC